MRGRANLKTYLLSMTVLLILIAISHAHGPAPPYRPPKTIYVDNDAIGANDGSSWENAYIYLQDALEIDRDGDEIRVARGIYKPDQGASVMESDRREYFHINNSITLKGGYAGINSTDPNTRDTELYETILSGDLQGNDVDVNNPHDLLDEPTRDENSHHVLICEGSDLTLDGFVITGGMGTITRENGGGLLATGGEITLIDCTFLHNRARRGGAFWGNDTNLKLIECRFIGNCATDWCGGVVNLGNAFLTGCTFHKNVGGALYNEGGSGMPFESGKLEINDCSFSYNVSLFGDYLGSSTVRTSSKEVSIRNCVFNSNTATCAAAIYGCNVDMLENCIFTGNSAISGGALYFESAIIRNCIFTGNRAIDGAVLNGWDYVYIENCTFADNLAHDGYIFAASRGRGGTPSLEMTVKNSILLYGDNPFDEFNISINHSNIQSHWPGEGNIDVDPLFAAPGYWTYFNDPNMIVETDNPNFVLIDGRYYLNYPQLRGRGRLTGIPIWTPGDYHLKSQAGRYDPNSGSWVVDNVTSLCIDAGDPNSFAGDEPFPNGRIINMGAYGGTTEASMSLSTSD